MDPQAQPPEKGIGILFFLDEGLNVKAYRAVVRAWPAVAVFADDLDLKEADCSAATVSGIRAATRLQGLCRGADLLATGPVRAESTADKPDPVPAATKIYAAPLYFPPGRPH
jgi:hypothetical protein